MKLAAVAAAAAPIPVFDIERVSCEVKLVYPHFQIPGSQGAMVLTTAQYAWDNMTNHGSEPIANGWSQ
jgi:hypothetical protein